MNCICGGKLYTDGPNRYARVPVTRFLCGACGKRVQAPLNETDADHWQRAGYRLVMRHGSLLECMKARENRREVRRIQRNTEAWLAQRATWAQERAA